jgi:hypothetical protein
LDLDQELIGLLEPAIPEITQVVVMHEKDVAPRSNVHRSLVCASTVPDSLSYCTNAFSCRSREAFTSTRAPTSSWRKSL